MAGKGTLPWKVEKYFGISSAEKPLRP